MLKGQSFEGLMRRYRNPNAVCSDIKGCVAFDYTVTAASQQL
jgi:hypothetical protein